MKAIFQNTFLTGLLAAISVVASDFLNAFVLHPDQAFAVLPLVVAVGIAGVGYLGSYLTGSANTSAALIGSAVVAIVPLLSTGKINWSLVAATFAIKLLGLLSGGKAESKPATPTS